MLQNWPIKMLWFSWLCLFFFWSHLAYLGLVTMAMLIFRCWWLIMIITALEFLLLSINLTYLNCPGKVVSKAKTCHIFPKWSTKVSRFFFFFFGKGMPRQKDSTAGGPPIHFQLSLHLWSGTNFLSDLWGRVKRNVTPSVWHMEPIPFWTHIWMSNCFNRKIENKALRVAEYQNQYGNKFKVGSGTESSKRECKIIVGGYLT